jgi:16S rRNA (guanine527-N7)-methyltransferase
VISILQKFFKKDLCKMEMEIPDFVERDLEALELALPESVLEGLQRYAERVLEANQRVNLTGARDLETLWRRHIIDSLTALPGLADLPADAPVVDVGSGGGLPGVPIALARPDLRVTLLEATGKKARFLEETAAALGLERVTVHRERAETAGRDPAHRQRYATALARAIGRMPVVLECALPLLRRGRRLLAFKGGEVEGELRASTDALATLGGGQVEVIEAYPEGFGVETTLVRVAKAEATPQAYPRRPGEPKKAPL